MLSVMILCVGTVRDAFYKQAAAEYEKRLSRYCRLQIIELPEQPLPESAAPGDIRRALAKEGDAIRAKIPPGARVYALSPEGRILSSEEFARIAPETAQQVSRLVFLIGGSHGLSPEVKSVAHGMISMSRMTFPHTLARVMLLEQLYRGFQIEAGGPYHK